MAGCRDCRTCTMRKVVRVPRALAFGWWVWAPKTLVRTCPRCSHTLRRHA
ncbi:hypothetical protein [Amycolatopsis anabasis]|nr:hypothetical protein [Amycolatopsis anabasis]